MDSFDREAKLRQIGSRIPISYNQEAETGTFPYFPGSDNFGPRGEQILDEAVRMRLGLTPLQQAPNRMPPGYIPPGYRAGNPPQPGVPAGPPTPISQSPTLMEAMRRLLLGE